MPGWIVEVVVVLREPAMEGFDGDEVSIDGARRAGLDEVGEESFDVAGGLRPVVDGFGVAVDDSHILLYGIGRTAWGDIIEPLINELFYLG